MVALFLWRVDDPFQLQSAFDETGRTNVQFYSQRCVKNLARGDIIAPVHTQRTDVGRKVAVPGLWVVVSVLIDEQKRTLAQGKLLVFQGDYVKWTADLKEFVACRVQSPVRASHIQEQCLVNAGVLLSEARKLSKQWR